MKILSYLSMIAIILMCGSYVMYHLFFLAYALRSLVFSLVLLGLIIVVIRGMK